MQIMNWEMQFNKGRNGLKMRTPKGINWQDVEEKIIRQFENTAEYFYITKAPNKPHWPEYHYHYVALQLFAELKGWA